MLSISPRSTFILLCCLTQPALAMDLEFAVTGWHSSGNSRWSHNASVLNNIWGNPTSELSYENLDSDVLEVSVVLPLANNRLRFALGSGIIDDGLLVDDDYVSATGATYYGATVSGAHRISRTHSDISGDGLFFLNAEYHPDLFHFDFGSHSMQLYAGLHYWREEYTATGIRQIECTDATASNGRTFCNPVGFSGFNDRVVITNKVNWTTWYIGAQSRLQLSQVMSLHLKLNYSPFSYLSNEDTHHLRSDLRQDPSFSMTGFGQAVDLELDWRYIVTDSIELSLGYRYWDRKVKGGDWYAYSNGGTSIAPLIEMRTTRKGLTLGLNVVF